MLSTRRRPKEGPSPWLWNLREPSLEALVLWLTALTRGRVRLDMWPPIIMLMLEMSTLHPPPLALGTIAHAELWQSIYTGMGAVPSPHTTPSPHGDISHSCIYYIRGLGTTGLQSRYHHYSLGDWLVLWSPCRVLMPYKVFYLEFENLYVDIRFVCYIYLKCKSCRYHLRDCSAECNLIIIKNVAKQNYNYPQPDIL